MADKPPGEEIVSAGDVAAGLDRLAEQLQPIVASHPCTLLGVMTGGMYPLMQLVSRLHGDFLIDYCHATRYAGGMTGGELEWLVTPRLPLRDRVAIVVDDILDAGHTLAGIRELCTSLGAAQVLTAVMTIKDLGDVQQPQPDFSAGIVVPNRYVFGCGMDLNEAWRHLDSIYALPDDEQLAERVS
jgi:hypoxanthine phosphoribosyltransferase